VLASSSASLPGDLLLASRNAAATLPQTELAVLGVEIGGEHWV
jgi:hypothetical protein